MSVLRHMVDTLIIRCRIIYIMTIINMLWFFVIIINETPYHQCQEKHFQDK